MVNHDFDDFGNLKLIWPRGPRDELRELMATRDEYALLDELLDAHRGNGSLYPFRPGNGEPCNGPFIGLTDAPCITDDLTCEGDGRQVVNGTLYAYVDYQVKSFAEELIRLGSVTFPRIDGNDEHRLTARSSCYFNPGKGKDPVYATFERATTAETMQIRVAGEVLVVPNCEVSHRYDSPVRFGRMLKAYRKAAILACAN